MTVQNKCWNITELINVSADFLAQKNIENPRLDAEILLCTVLGYNRLKLYMNFDQPLTSEQLNKYRSFISRRSKHEPVAYITGQKEFMSLCFNVNSTVLIPRPDTEHLVEYIINKYSHQQISILDIGTGSGAIAITLKKYLPHAHIAATDVSLAALRVAQKNALQHNADIQLVCCSTCRALNRSFDVIVSNPPYITEHEFGELESTVRLFEPRCALVGGADGIDTYTEIASLAENVNTKEIVVEISDTVCNDVCEIFKKNGFHQQQIITDHAGHKRILCCEH